MSLKAELRTQTGTGAARKARREGMIPVSLYGKDTEAVSLLINRREFEALLKAEGTNAVFDVEYDGKTQKVILHDYERAALKDEVYSVDLNAISADQKLQVEVPLHAVNIDTVKVGIVEVVINDILVETKPDSIPSHFEIDVEGMEIGDTKTVADLDKHAGVEVLLDPEEVVITVSAPTEEAEPVEDDEEAPEPEVIGEEAEASEEE